MGILVLGIVVLAISLPQSLTFRCAYNLGRNNSTLTRDQISEYCSNNQSLKTENAEDLITIGFGIIVIVIGFIIIGIGGIWLIVRRRGRTEASSSGLSSEMINNNRQQEEDDNWFTPKKVLLYCIIVGLISGTLSIFISLLILLSMAAFVFASITVWYLLGEKFHSWKERRSRNVFTGQ